MKKGDGKPLPDQRVQAEILLKAPASQTIELDAKSEFPKRDPDVATDIPLLVFPVAAQQSATLIADRRLIVEDGTGTNALSPAGYTSLSTGFEGLKFAYDPIRVSQVKMRTGELQPAAGWLSQVVSRTTYLGTGAQTLDISARLYAASAGPLTFRFPHHWRLRSAHCDNRKLIVKTNPESASVSEVWLPQFANDAAGCDLEIVVDGPEIALEHKQRFELPKWSVDSKIVSQRSELWLPRSVGLRRFLSFDKWFTFPVWELSRILPSAWWKSLSPSTIQLATDVSTIDESTSQNHSVSASEAWLAWNSDEEPLEAGDIRSTQNSFTLSINQTEQSANWLRVFIGLATALCLSSYRSSILGKGLLLTTMALLIVHPIILPYFQQVALGWLLACFLRFFHSAIVYRSEGEENARFAISVDSRGGKSVSLKSFPSRGNSLTRSVNVWFFAMLSSIGGLCMMKEAWAVDEAETVQNMERYDVVLPVDERGEIASTVAYIPEKTTSTT